MKALKPTAGFILFTVVIEAIRWFRLRPTCANTRSDGIAPQVEAPEIEVVA